jgi:hypothetical protein
MSNKPFIRWVALWFVAFAVGCGDEAADPGSGEKNPDVSPGNTEVSLLISDPQSASDELAMVVDFVSYRITCPPSGLTPFDDSVDISGNFEIVAERDPPVWEMATDLPPALCTITLLVFHDDEVVCSGDKSLPIVEDGDPSTVNEFNLLLVCNISVDPPSGELSAEGAFEFVQGNACPHLIWLNAVPSVIPPSVPAVTSVELYSFDPDGACGQNCDPQTCDFSTQTCDFSTNPPVCTPAPDPGLATTFFAQPDVGSFVDPNAASTTYTCDPLSPGSVDICALASDGDIECDRTRCVSVVCP